MNIDTEAKLCMRCADDDHSGHHQHLGGICIGCTCGVRPAELFDLDSFEDGDPFFWMYLTADGWCSDGAAVVRSERVYRFEPGPQRWKPVEYRVDAQFAADEVLTRYDSTGVAHGAMVIFTAEGGDCVLIHRRYVDGFDLETLWRAQGDGKPMINAATLEAATVAVMRVMTAGENTDHPLVGDAAIRAHKRMHAAAKALCAMADEIAKGATA